MNLGLGLQNKVCEQRGIHSLDRDLVCNGVDETRDKVKELNQMISSSTSRTLRDEDPR